MSEERDSRDGQVRIVYIAGSKNCGSTLLDAILGNAPQARSLGEVGGFHRYEDEAPCACAEPPASCVPCREALHAVDPCRTGEFRRLSRLPIRERCAHWLFVPSRNRRRYAAVADRLFERVATTTGRTVLIDSSKNASRAAALAHDSRFDVRVIHLVRDGRGYLRSRRNRASRDGRRHWPPVSMASWLAKNLLLDVGIGRRLGAAGYLLCRYEDLLNDPEAELGRLGDFAGVDTTSLPVLASAPPGARREHLFEPARRTDYRWVQLDRSRLESQRETPLRNAVFWLLGGFVSVRWGYDRRQSYLADRTGGAGS